MHFFSFELYPRMSWLFMLGCLFAVSACDSSGNYLSGDPFDPLGAKTAFIKSGKNLEGVRKAGQAPYSYKPEDKSQRYVASSETKTLVFNSQGDVVAKKDRVDIPSYGSLYLQHSSAGDFLFTFGSSGKELCPVGEGFCQIDSPAVADPHTTDAKYARNNKGEQLHNSLYRVRAGHLLLLTEDGNGFVEAEVFDGTSLPDASENLFSYDPIGAKTGIGASSDGFAYFINTETDDAIRIDNGMVGVGVRDVVCTPLSDGRFACVIQSFTDAMLTLCIGKTSSDFTCNGTADVGNGVSIGVAESRKGNIAVVSPGYSDGAVYLTEFTPQFGVAYQGSFFMNDFIDLHTETGIRLDFIGHAEIDEDNKALLVTGNSFGVVALVLFSDLDTNNKELFGSSAMPLWFK